MGIMNYTKVLRIVSVKLEDGTERQVDDNCLRRYIELRDIQTICLSGVSPYQMRDEWAAMRLVLREEKSKTNSKNASKPKRDDVTKEQLLAFKFKYEEGGKSHGWKKVACLEYDVDLKTLNKRMKE